MLVSSPAPTRTPHLADRDFLRAYSDARCDLASACVVWLCVALFPAIASGAGTKVVIYSDPEGASVSLAGESQVCKPLKPGGASGKTPCSLSFDSAAFDPSGRLFENSKILATPLQLTVSTKGYQPKTITITDGPHTWKGRDVGRGVEKTYYFIRAPEFRVQLEKEITDPQQTRSGGDIVTTVRKAGAHLFPETVQAWSGNRVAYDALVKMLQDDPEVGWDWRKSIDALAVVSAGDDQLASEAFGRLKDYASSAYRFDTTAKFACRPVGGSETPFSDAGVMSKEEVPVAMSTLARLTNSNAVRTDAIAYLKEAATAEFWKGAGWASQPSYESDFDRNLDLAARSISALGEICIQQSKDALAQVVKSYPSLESMPEILRERVMDIGQHCGPTLKKP